MLIKQEDRKWDWVARALAFLAVLSLAFVPRFWPGERAPFRPRAATAAAYPLKKSANGRYVVDQNDTPFLIIGDTAWSLMVNISEADAATYFANRQAAGFNVVMMNLICGTYTAGRSDSSTYDGITPFTGFNAGKNTYDLTTPRDTYFEHVDRIINLAAAYGITIFLDPLDTGSYYRPEGTPTMQDNGAAKCRVYGQDLGKRYKNFPNIVWQHGNDYDYPTLTADGDQYTTAIALGIKDVDANHLHTIELGAPSGSLDDPNWTSIVSLDAAYTWSPTYAQVLTNYNRANFAPVFTVEDHYEGEAIGYPPEANNVDLGTPLVNRKQDYWTVLSGATGKLYGNYCIWRFLGGWNGNLGWKIRIRRMLMYFLGFDSGNAVWKGQLNTQCVAELGYMKALFEPRRWYDLVPDQAHTVVIFGYGSYASSGKVSENDYVTAARTSDGSLVVVYLPTRRTITVDMTKLRGPVTARWYDPTNGTFSVISGTPFVNSGTRNFAPPGNNSAGEGDWVLLIER